MMDFQTYFELVNLYNDYAMACDSERWEQWPDFFVERILSKACRCVCSPYKAKP
jgi:salicylate 5-hydroxylase small subunit